MRFKNRREIPRNALDLVELAEIVFRYQCLELKWVQAGLSVNGREGSIVGK